MLKGIKLRFNEKLKKEILSARDDNDSEIEALRAGADDYIRKP